ncbi:IS66 family transposase (plasmid) [Pseudohalocynthiibacter aestuariivivens]|nr:IS66 family transposase [Pseudohalocynthiibacter aestuariivivens]QIE44218.1 IS66 family transposase [Pseudohalocynthiibacter aestuariivivens]QIE47866.1 IS66 family transposase [Pseudohalocynthiibacter aestuariivivens]QIE47976.1 IS66 family transposase [Pseudohalocynthiibacter aestuariivivens]QIE48021.1 IS66 family transposase [Pseudohalocynthiibacter aestuariivivens]QIE48215.1 IS66 family transposase [Pseudohalocynthiibacter aestuariivivens]
MTVPDKLPDDIAELKAIIRAQQDQNARLEALVASFKKALFGAKSEKIDPAQYELELEDIETAIAQVKAEIDADERTAPVRPAKPRQSNRGSLPKHLERVEVIIEPDVFCACGAERHVIGEDVSERLDIIPAQFRVIVTRRPKYACRSCEGGITQAPALAHIIAGGMPTEATLAHVLVSKYADHLPLYRQAQIYSRQGINLDRSTLAAWVGKSAFELTPIYDALMADLKHSTKLFMDETPAPVLAPGRKRTKTGYFWALARDDRPWGGDDPPGVAFTYAPGRSGQHAEDILKSFSGTLQVDGYAGYNRLLKRPAQDVTLAYCWAHARRKLHDVTQSGAAPIAQEGLAQIQALYRIEKDLRGQTAEQRLAARQDRSKPIIDAFELWLVQNRARVSAKSPTGEALKYIAKYWDGLILFLSDGRIELDSNAVERTIRPIALNRKNALFAGHDAGAQNWAVIASLIETCKLNEIEPHGYLSAVLTAIAEGHKQTDINKLLPWNYVRPV